MTKYRVAYVGKGDGRAVSEPRELGDAAALMTKLRADGYTCHIEVHLKDGCWTRVSNSEVSHLLKNK